MLNAGDADTITGRRKFVNVRQFCDASGSLTSGSHHMIYGFCDPSDIDALQERLSVCIDEVFSWMMSNRLQLNPSKTEVLWKYRSTSASDPDWSCSCW